MSRLFPVSCALLTSVIIGCDSGPTTLTLAPLEVRVATVGQATDLDSDGYDLVVDGRIVQTLLPNATTMIEDLEPGDHTVVLSNVESNCSHTGQNPQFVTLKRARVSRVDFALACIPRRGGLRVAVTTTGPSPDPDGYLLQVLSHRDDGEITVFSGRVGVNDEMTLEAIPAGPIEARLLDLLAWCFTTGENPRHTDVEHGATRVIGFDVACPEPVTLEVAVSTTGAHTQPNGYTVLLRDEYASQVIAAPENGTVRIEELVPRDYTLLLQGAGASCDADGNPRTVAATVGGLHQEAFEVSCAAPREFAFVSAGEADTEIFVARDDGTGMLRLTDNETADEDPAWSPDGDRIVFTTERDGNAEIYVMAADGTGAVRLTDDPASDRQPAWSPDGETILFVSDRDGNPEIYALALQDGSIRRLTTYDGTDASPAWSPDGTQIAFVRGSRVWLMNADGSGGREIRSANCYDFIGYTCHPSAPGWSPDGGRIAYAINWCYWEYECYGDLFTVAADDSEYQWLQYGEATTHVLWYPDGRKIAYSTGCDGLEASYVEDCPRNIRLLRTGVEVLTLLEGQGGSFAWRPAP